MGKPAKPGGTISGNKRDNVLTGTDDADVIDGKGGDDTLSGLGGDDTLLGGDGNDTLDGGSGSDTLDGGTGFDTAVYYGTRDDYVVTQIDATTVTIEAPDGSVDTVTNVESFAFADVTQSFDELVTPPVADLTLVAADPAAGSDLDLNGGASVAMSYEIANTGNVDAGSFEVVTVLSTDGTLSGDDIEIGRTSYALAAGDTGTFDVTLAVGDDLPAGNYQVITYVVWADEDAGNTGDNLVVATQEIEFVGGTSYGTDGDDTFTGLDIDETFDLGAGDDTVIASGGNDVVIGGDGVDMVAFDVRREDATVTQIDADSAEITTADGTTTVHGVETFVFADVTQDFATLIEPAEADVAAGEVSLTDASLAPGETTEVSWSVSQEGVVTSGATSTELVIATAPDMGDVIEVADSQTAVLTTQGDSLSWTTVLDTAALAPGTYYIAAVADAGDVLAEGDEANNLSGWTELVVEAPVANLTFTDLVVEPTSDLDVDGGASVDVTFTVTNTGNVDLGSYAVELFASEDNVADYMDDDYLGYFQFDGLAAGESMTVTLTRPLDTLVIDGDYNLIGQITNLVAPGTDTTDDTFVATGAITIDRPDIVDTDDGNVTTGTALSETFYLGGGDDTFVLSGGSDVAYGGDGFDTLDASGAGTGLSIFADPTDPGDVTVTAGEMYPDTGDTLIAFGFERIVGSAHDDVIGLMDGPGVVIEAGAGDDVAFGTVENDVIDGGDGMDGIAGWFGDDVLTGGAGADAFAFLLADDGNGGTTGHGHDVITDFTVGEDLIDVQVEGMDPAIDPMSWVQQTADGTLIVLADDSSVLLQGVDAADLTADSFYVHDPWMAYAY